MVCLYSVENWLLTFPGKDRYRTGLPLCPHAQTSLLTHKRFRDFLGRSHIIMLRSPLNVSTATTVPAISYKLLPYPCFQLPIPYSITIFFTPLLLNSLLPSPYSLLHTPYIRVLTAVLPTATGTYLVSHAN
jgi:hypothetical protein